MPLAARALRYVRGLHRQARLAATIRSTVEDVRRFGAGGPFRHALDEVGVATYRTVRYPVGGVRFKVRAGSFWKYWRCLEAGTEDLECLRFLATLVRPGDTVLDVGAWEGPYTLLLASLVGDEGQVHAFEPDPRARANLRANAAANGFRNVTIDERCVSDGEDEVSFYDARGGTIGSLLRNDLVAGLALGRKRATTVDRYCRERALRIDGMKVDVEGAEALVVSGAEGIITRDAPWLFLEFHGVLMASAAREAAWARITRNARDVTFVHGRSRRYRAGDRLDGYPDCDYFHVLVRY